MGLSVIAQTDSPFIQSIRLERTNLVVTAQVPPGLKRIVLESRDRFERGTWQPCAVQRLAGNGGTVTFSMPRSAPMAMLRVRAAATETLPASFFAGTTLFPEQAVPAPGDNAPSAPLDGGLNTVLSTDTTTTSANPPSSPGTPDPSRSVVESDIWKISGDTLFFFNSYRGLQIIDVANPDAAFLRGSLNIPAAGEQMYLLGPDYVVLLVRDGCDYQSASAVMIVSVAAGQPVVVARLPVPGIVTESRLVGTALYVATVVSRPVAGSTNGAWEVGTQISSFDLALPAAPVARSTLWYPGPDNVVAATDHYFFAVTQSPTNYSQSVVQVIDISAPDGTMTAYCSITPAGRVTDKFKLDCSGAVLSLISEVTSPSLLTKLETFRLPDPRSMTPLGPGKLGEIELGGGERLYASRFDGQKVYGVTFRQIDPLWVVDLSDPAHPTISGELQVPGLSTYIHPLGDQLVAVGTESGHVVVSLFDVSRPKLPALLSRVPLGNWSYSEANQDEKAFTVLPEAGLLLLPVQGMVSNSYISWVQLIDLGSNSLAARGIIEQDFAPRRATLHRERIVSLSGHELLSVDATDRDHPLVRAELALAWPVDRVFAQGDYLIEMAFGNSWMTQNPELRVVSASDPDQLFSTVSLSPQGIVGATILSNRLYVVQGPGQLYGPVLWNDAGPLAPELLLSVFDLANLPALALLGTTSVAADSWGYSDLQPVWPRPGLLVWAGSKMDGWYWWGGPVALNGIISGFWPYRGGTHLDLLAFDVSRDGAPVFLSQASLGANDCFSFSK
ncbi:MAG: beta-propeller domain-containing protein, partial [Verrucomicrobia bacterium]|nr:beta-propeller domain-containing protein [Verrucomicrobiota bacterium]